MRIILPPRTGGSVDDVYFSIANHQDVDTDIDLKVAADHDKIGWFLLSDPTTIHWLASTDGDSYSFNPHGDAFGIAAEDVTTGNVFYSDESIGDSLYGTQDCFNGDNHLAWFGDAPEPAAWGLMGLGLIGLGTISRMRKNLAKG